MRVAMPDELGTVAAFHDLTQAQAARAALEGEGISSHLLDETTGSIDWGLMPAMGGCVFKFRRPRQRVPARSSTASSRPMTLRSGLVALTIPTTSTLPKRRGSAPPP